MKKLSVLSILLAIVIPCSASTITVNWDGTGDHTTIQAGINAAVSGADTIIVAEGTYTGSGNRDIDFLGKAIAVQSESGPKNCIIDCNGTESEPHRGFYFHSGEGTTSILSGFTITNGYDDSWDGSAIKLQNSSPLISKCIIRDNADGHGGPITCQNSSPLISECIICDNIYRDGGAITQDINSSSTITNCVITRNIATSWDGYGGGVVGGGGTISNCIIAGNIIKRGAGICHYSGLIINCSIVGNRSMYEGAGVFWFEGELTNCIIWGNTVEGGSVPNGDVQVWDGYWTSMPAFCCIQDWERGGVCNIIADPCFISPGTWEDPCSTPDDMFDDVWLMGDYHLKSMFGRWNPNQSDWVYDAATSPCIDASDPNSDWTGELWPHGTRINMGAYGGTPQASMSPSTSGHAADLNNDYMINLSDLPVFGEAWSRKELLPCAGDVDRNGLIETADLRIVGQNWLTILNHPPEVLIVEPQDGSEHLVFEPLEIEADAWSIDSSVVRVEFLIDGSVIGEDNDGSDGWNTIWGGGWWGVTVITARATDDEGAITTSWPITVNIISPL